MTDHPGGMADRRETARPTNNNKEIAMTIQSIPLGKLTHSPLNVRKTGGSIDDLAASISAHGLIQTLTVRPAEKGKFEVIAGGRRLSALQRLLKEKGSAAGTPVTKDYAVDCRVLADENAEEISLAENEVRQAMHPADQFEAFRKLSESGQAPADIAARFGVSERTVQQRLKLATVSPKLMKLYREGAMSLDVLMAFTVSDDHKAQENVWKAEKAYPNANVIRRKLTDSKTRLSAPLAKFVGEAAYVAAGGTITRDLFAEEGQGYIDDAALLEQLANAKLQATAEQVRGEGWGEVRICLDQWFSPYRHDLEEAEAPSRDLTEAEEIRIADIRERLEALADDDSAAAEDEAERLEAELDTIEEAAAKDWTQVADKSGMIAVVTMEGVYRGFAAEAEDEVDADEAGEGDAALPLVTSGQSASAEKPKAECSAALLESLTAHRTLAMQAEMAGNPAAALDTLVWTLASSHFNVTSSDSRVAKITAQRHFVGQGALKDSKAAHALGQKEADWKAVLPKKAAALWQWIRSTDQATKLELLAFLVAASLDAVQVRGAPATANSHQVHEALGLDMADWWDPTADNYLSRVGKEKVLDALAANGETPAALAAFSAMKKAALVEKAEEALRGSRWLPGALKVPGAEQSQDKAEAA